MEPLRRSVIALCIGIALVLGMLAFVMWLDRQTEPEPELYGEPMLARHPTPFPDECRPLLPDGPSLWECITYRTQP